MTNAQSAKKTGTTSQSSELPIALRVANVMNKLNVAGLPRNYELFYIAITDAVPALKEELWGLGKSMDQQALDDLHGRFCAKADDEAVVRRICRAVESRVGETISLIRQEARSVSDYGRVLNQASQHLDPSRNPPPQMVNKIVGLVSEATTSTLEQNDQTLQEINSKSSQLQSIRSELAEYKRLAETDPMTGLLNRRAFDNLMARLTEEQLQNCALIIGDIDKFKALNDTYGHPFGDIVIRTVADVIARNARDGTALARIGGEEFALLAGNIDEESISILAERIRVAINQIAMSDGRINLEPGTVTMSLGACHGSAAANSDELYLFTDEALYFAKRSGRNRVSSHADVIASPDRKELFVYRN